MRESRLINKTTPRTANATFTGRRKQTATGQNIFAATGKDENESVEKSKLCEISLQCQLIRFCKRNASTNYIQLNTSADSKTDRTALQKTGKKLRETEFSPAYPQMAKNRQAKHWQAESKKHLRRTINKTDSSSSLGRFRRQKEFFT